MQMRRSLTTGWRVVRKGWNGALTATVVLFIVAYVLIVLDILGLI